MSLPKTWKANTRTISGWLHEKGGCGMSKEDVSYGGNDQAMFVVKEVGGVKK